MDKKAYEISVNRALSKQAQGLTDWDTIKDWAVRNKDYLIGAGATALLSGILGKKKNFWRNLLLGGAVGTGAVWGARALGLDKYWTKSKEESKKNPQDNATEATNQNNVLTQANDQARNLAKKLNLGVNGLRKLNPAVGSNTQNTGDYYPYNPREFGVDDLNYVNNEDNPVYDQINNGELVVGLNGYR